VLDEPTNGLDPNQIVEVRHLIKEIAEDHSVMLSTHILPEVQATCDDIKMIEHGEVVFSGSMEDFNHYMEPNTFIVIMSNPPSMEQLQQIPGITHVEHITDTRFRMQFSTAPDITKKIIELSVTNNWRLHELILERDSLDAAFAQLSGKNIHK
ncbi:MAG: ABC transporter ATP-binding protein, partial [Butyricimonas faecihominis]